MDRRKYNKEVDRDLESAIIFLAENFQKTGHNSKPVIFHSIKVAMYLYDLDYDKDLIMAAILHDVIEDTDVAVHDIEKKFGKKIARMVEDLSFRSDISDRVEQYKEMFERTKLGGRELLLIKCADIFQNSYFVGTDIPKDDYFLGKMKYFLGISKELIGDEKPWKDLRDRLDFIIEHNVID